jgi:arsenate reductase (glutaredoxin)
MLHIYGIPNCDTIQKAIKWLKANNLAFEFHDYKKEGITEKKLIEWLKKAPIEKLLNKASATYKGLSDTEKPANQADIIQLMIEKPSCIKRPVIEFSETVLVGFDEKVYLEKLVK